MCVRAMSSSVCVRYVRSACLVAIVAQAVVSAPRRLQRPAPDSGGESMAVVASSREAVLVPQAPFLALDIDPQTQRTWLCHRLTQERACLDSGDARGEWSIEYTDEGEAYIDSGEESRFAQDVLKLGVYEAGGEWYIGDGTRSMAWDEWSSERKEFEATIPFGRSASLVNLCFAKFRNTYGARLWWRLDSLYRVSGLSARKSAADWVQSMFPAWQKLQVSLSLHSCHLRRGMPRADEEAHPERDFRVLDRPSCSSLMLVAIAARLAYLPRARGGLKSEEAQTCIVSMMEGLFHLVPERLDIELFLDERVGWDPPARPAGSAHSLFGCAGAWFR